MLDFTELPSDGIKFEQLTRELLLKAGLRPFWTGVGADSGRDLLAEEAVQGALTSDKKTWLVDCKHFASSGRAVGVGDVIDIRDRCERVGASGFLLATSTHPSSELTRKLSELDTTSAISVLTWDAVEIERRLLNPGTYAIAQQFFPSSPEASDWRVFYSERENRWMAHFRGYFMYLESRAGLDPPSFVDLEKIVDELESVPAGADESIRVRAIWHDTPNGPFFNCWADYLVPSDHPPTRSPLDLKTWLPEDVDGDGLIVNWDVRLQLTLPHSDYHDLDDPQFYGRFKEPLYNALYGTRLNNATEENPDWWTVNPPPIRTFNDRLMWQQHQSLHGFGKDFVTMPPYRTRL